MQALITMLILSLAGAGAVWLTQDELTAIQTEGEAKTSLISSLNRKGTLRAATIKWQLDTGSTVVPTPPMLVASGYLEPEFLAAD